MDNATDSEADQAPIQTPTVSSSSGAGNSSTVQPAVESKQTSGPNSDLKSTDLKDSLESEKKAPKTNVPLGQFAYERTHQLLFRGWYTDRVFSEALGGYADRIQLDDCEIEAIKAFKAVSRKYKKDLGRDDSFTQKQGGTLYLLVSWPPGTQSFGHYWFMVENASIGAKGIMHKVKVMRPVLYVDDQSNGKCPHCGKFPTASGDDPRRSSAVALDLSEVAAQLQDHFQDLINPKEWWQNARTYCTLENLVTTVKFIVLLFMAFIAGLANLLPKLVHLLNRTIHESAFFVRSATPFLLGCLDIVNKAIGGLYLLLAMIWRDARRPSSPAPPARQALEGPNSSFSGADRPKYPYQRANVQRPYLQ